MAIEKIGDVKSTGNNSFTESVGNILGKDDFLRLLVTELKYQNPLSPLDNKEFISQMAQFSSLEQLQNMNKSIEDIKTLQSLSQMNFAVNIINHRVVGYDANGNIVDGIVENISFQDGEPYVITGGKVLNLKNLIKIY
jgi:flagellar basal-body rod modification protein FlgD